MNQPRLIETDFPLRAVSAASGGEKNREGHIATLHVWWARRPLAASRATALAALLPDDPKRRNEFRELVEQIAPWEVVSGKDPSGEKILQKARALIREAYEGRAPRVLDCFAGGGIIPLEALRLGCETYALDYNPVAVLLNKAVLEYPQKFGKPVIQSQLAHVRGLNEGQLGLDEIRTERHVNWLVEAVRRWGRWVEEEAGKELARFYPKQHGEPVLGYIWARTIPCQHPDCGAEIPILHQTWLADRKKQTVALRLIPNRSAKRVDLQLAEGARIDFDPSEGTISEAHVRCPLHTYGTIDEKTLRKLVSAGKLGHRLVAAVIGTPRNAKRFRLISKEDIALYHAAQDALERKRKALSDDWHMEAVPDEQLTTERPSPNARGVSAVTRYEILRWGELLNDRQKLAVIVFAEKVRQVYKLVLEEQKDKEFAKAVTTYLALSVDKLAVNLTTLTRWCSDALSFERPFDRPALSMVWDYGEINPLSDVRGGWDVESGVGVLAHLAGLARSEAPPVTVTQGSATELPWPDNSMDAVFTDPPYYDNVPYADLSDFFYVWLKRTIGELYPDLFSTPLTPKSTELIWHQRHGGSYEAGKAFFEKEIANAFREIHRVLKPNGIAVIVYAHKKTEAWEAILNAILSAGLFMTASWPIHTELTSRLNAQETASLASSVYMVCRKRTSEEVGEFQKVRREIDERVRQKLAQFWDEGIRGADFFMSAIGPAVEAFGKYARVEKQSGDAVTVPELMEYVRKVVSEFALHRILQRAQLGGVDTLTRFYALWRWTYNHSRVPYDEARKLATAVGIELTEHWDAGGLVEKQKDYIVVPMPQERAKDAKFAKQTQFTTMVDALHRALALWEKNREDDLKEHLTETYGGNESFWEVAQDISDLLPEDDQEKKALQGLLYGRKGYAGERKLI